MFNFFLHKLFYKNTWCHYRVTFAYGAYNQYYKTQMVRKVSHFSLQFSIQFQKSTLTTRRLLLNLSVVSEPTVRNRFEFLYSINCEIYKINCESY